VTRCGLCALIGRPNVGKSTLLNRLVGTKVSITAPTPHTTRSVVRGVLTEGEVQVVFVDTPGLHRPRTSLGGRLNDAARAGAEGVDVIAAMVEAGREIGAGDRAAIGTALEAARRDPAMRVAVLVNKVDRVGPTSVAEQLLGAQGAVEELASEGLAERVEYFPLSARNGRGVEAFTEWVSAQMPESPFLFPADEVSDVPEAAWVAELVREQLVRKTRQELPHSIHCRVTEFAWPHVTVEILVERESQKGMVIGRGGQLLKEVGTAARRQLPEGTFLELRVTVEPDWQRRADALDRFGY
jgi:GTP-binding protein Era